MDQKRETLYPSAPLENIVLEQRLQKKLNDVTNFNSSINKINEMVTYFKDENHKAKKRYKKYKKLITILKSFDTIVIIGTTSNSITLSLTGIGSIAIPVSSGIACGSTISNKVVYEIVTQKYNENKKQIKKVNKQLNLSINCIENLYKKT